MKACRYFCMNIAEYILEFKIFQRTFLEKEDIFYAECTCPVNLKSFEIFKENSSRYLKKWISRLSSQKLEAT
jgi:hypothetical protein